MLRNPLVDHPEILLHLIKEMPYSVAIFDCEMKYLSYSKLWLQTFNLQGDDLLGRTHYEVVPDTPQDRRELYARAIKNAATIACDKELIRDKNGEDRYVKWSITPWFQGQSVGGIMVMCENITDAVIEGKKLKESEAQLQEAQKVAQIGSWSFDLASGKIKWTPQMYSIFPENINDGEPSYERHKSTIHEEDLEAWESTVKKCIADGQPYEMLFRAVHPDRFVWVKANGKGLLDSEGNVLGLLGTCQDVTEQVILQEKLKHNEMRLNMALNNAGIGVWEWDLPSNKIIWDDRMFELYGVECKSEENPYEMWEESLHPDDKAKAIKDVQSALAEGSYFRSKFRVKLPEEKFRHILATAHVLRNSKGEAVKMFGLNMDITQQIGYEQLLKDSKLKAEQASEAKSRFLANMSHEIRTPMNGLIGMLDLLIHSEMQSEQKDYVETAMSCSENLLNILNDILDLSKIEAGKFEIAVQPFELKSALKNTVKIHALNAQKKGVQFLLNIEDSVPEVMVGDMQRVMQVVNNFLSNAVKFTESGSVAMMVKMFEDESFGQSISIAIKDTGIGIEQNMKNSLFQAFVQGDISITKKYGGTGLGLAISAKLATLMKGRILLESEQGRGSVFTLILPRRINSQAKNCKSIA